MSKIMIDTDKINDPLIPTATDSYNGILNARNSASKVSFPDGEYGWGNLYADIDECLSQTSRYLKWLEIIRDKYNSEILDSVEEINLLSIDDINSVK